MVHPLINLITAGLYIITGALLLRRLFSTGVEATAGTRNVILVLAAGAAVLHAVILYATIWLDPGLNLSLNNAASMLACVIVVFFLFVSLGRPVENLGVLVLPIAAATVLIAWLWPGNNVIASAAAPFLSAHLIAAFLAYGLLSLAVVQALLLLWQERRLRQKQPGRLIRALPALETMETLLFQMMAAGFVLLTITLISGTLFSKVLFNQPLVFTHHIVFSLLAWLVFGALIVGHWKFGWRGRSAIHWILGGFALLVLGYFGSKFVFEVLLRR